MLTPARLLVLACTLVLWAYMAATLVMRLYYGAVGCSLLVVLLLVAVGRVPLTGLGRAVTVPLLAYLWWVLGACWVPEPEDVLWWVLVEGSATLPVYSLFWLAASQLSFARLAGIWRACPLPGVIVTVVPLLLVPQERRVGWHALGVLPFVVPLLWVELLSGRRRLRAWAQLGLITATVVLLASRVPLALVLLLGLGSPWVLACTWCQAVRWVSGALAGSLLLVAALWGLPVTQPWLVYTVERVVSEAVEVEVGEVLVTGSTADEVREALNAEALAAWRVHWLVGLGYMQFGPRWFQHHYPDLWEGTATSLHRSLYTWGVEGGVPGLLLAAWLLGRHGWTLWWLCRRGQAADVRQSGYVLGLMTVGLIVLSWWHQAHQTPTWWAVLGMVQGVAQRQQTRARRECVHGTGGGRRCSWSACTTVSASAPTSSAKKAMRSTSSRNSRASRSILAYSPGEAL